MKNKLSGIVCDLLAVAGAALISIGAGMIFVPVGIIVAGILCIASAVLVARAIDGGDDG